MLNLKAALLAQSLGEPLVLCERLVECARSFTLVAEYHEAARYLERARDLAAERDLVELKGEVYRGFGALYNARGNFREAAVCFDRALERLEFSSRHDSTLRVLLDLSELYLREGRSAQAASLLRRAEAVPSAGDPALLVRIQLNLGRIAFGAGDRAGAVARYESAARAAEREGRSSDRELVAIGLTGLYLQEGRLTEAAARLREALALSIVAFSRESSRALERSRLQTIGQRLLELDVAADRAAAPQDLRRQLNEAVRLYNSHPLVIFGQVPRYGHMGALIETAAAPDGASLEVGPQAEIAGRVNPPNPK